MEILRPSKGITACGTVPSTGNHLLGAMAASLLATLGVCFRHLCVMALLMLGFVMLTSSTQATRRLDAECAETWTPTQEQWSLECLIEIRRMEPSQRNPLVGHVVRVSGKSAENIRVDRAELVFNYSLQCASLGPSPLNSVLPWQGSFCFRAGRTNHHHLEAERTNHHHLGQEILIIIIWGQKGLIIIISG